MSNKNNNLLHLLRISNNSFWHTIDNNVNILLVPLDYYIQISSLVVKLGRGNRPTIKHEHVSHKFHVHSFLHLNVLWLENATDMICNSDAWQFFCAFGFFSIKIIVRITNWLKATEIPIKKWPVNMRHTTYKMPVKFFGQILFWKKCTFCKIIFAG